MALLAKLPAAVRPTGTQVQRGADCVLGQQSPTDGVTRMLYVRQGRRIAMGLAFGEKLMSTTAIVLNDDVVSALQQLNQPLEHAARECIVLELYRRGTISSGKAAELLGMPRDAFIAYASRLGIAFFEMKDQEWAAERALSDCL